MKSVRFTLLLFTLPPLAMAGTLKPAFRGEISDTQCAMNVHSLSRSHEEMIAKQTIGTDAASCARACVKRGGEWALRSGEKVYHLKNQAGIEQFAGKEVVVSGTLDPKTETIDNSAIEEVPPSKKLD